MPFVRDLLLVAVVALAGCSQASTSSAASNASAAAATPVAAGSPVALPRVAAPFSLGANWYPPETFAGETFSWADNDAQILISAPASGAPPGRMFLDIDAGPGVVPPPARLEVIDRHGKVVRRFNLAKRSEIEVPVTDSLLRLHVANGGHKVPTDWRVLDFRIFAVAADAAGARAKSVPNDIVRGDGVALDAGWGALETFEGKTFRWVENDAQLHLTGGGRTLQFALESGPGVGTGGYELRLIHGATVLAKRRVPAGAQTVNFPVPHGERDLTLHVVGGGRRVPQDPRVLNVRVFTVRLAGP